MVATTRNPLRRASFCAATLAPYSPSLPAPRVHPDRSFTRTATRPLACVRAQLMEGGKRELQISRRIDILANVPLEKKKRDSVSAHPAAAEALRHAQRTANTAAAQARRAAAPPPRPTALNCAPLAPRAPSAVLVAFVCAAPRDCSAVSAVVDALARYRPRFDFVLLCSASSVAACDFWEQGQGAREKTGKKPMNDGQQQQQQQQQQGRTMLVIRAQGKTVWGLATRFLALPATARDYEAIFIWDVAALREGSAAAAALRVDRLASVALSFDIGIGLATPCDRRCGAPTKASGLLHGRWGWSKRETHAAATMTAGGAIGFSGETWGCISRYLGLAMNSATMMTLRNFSAAWPALCGEQRVGTVCLPPPFPDRPAGARVHAKASVGAYANTAPARGDGRFRACAAEPPPASNAAERAAHARGSIVALEQVRHELADAYEEWHMSTSSRGRAKGPLSGPMCSRGMKSLNAPRSRQTTRLGGGSAVSPSSFVKWERLQRGGLSPAVRALRDAMAASAGEEGSSRTPHLLVLDDGLSDAAFARELDVVLPLLFERHSGGARGKGALSVTFALRCDRSFARLLRRIATRALHERVATRAVLLRSRCEDRGGAIPGIVDALHRSVGPPLRGSNLVAWSPGHRAASATLGLFPPLAVWRSAYGPAARSVFARRLWSERCGERWEGMVCWKG